MYKGLKVGLVLGGGGAKGFSHIGILKVLEEKGIVPDYICGNSMGSIIGALYASGLSADEIEQFALKFDFGKIVDINIFTMLKDGLISGDKFKALMDKVLGGVEFKDLKIPFSCITANILNGEEVVLSEGKVADAVRGSMSIPGVFKPVEKDGMLLVDGGCVNNLPVDVVKQQGMDFIIAVDCIGKNNYTKDQLKSALDFAALGTDILTYNNSIKKAQKGSDVLISFNLNVKTQDFNKKAIQFAINTGEAEAEKKAEEMIQKLEEKNAELSHNF